MLVKWGLPMPRNKKGAAPVGERGELLGRLRQASDKAGEGESIKTSKTKTVEKRRAAGHA